MKRSSLFIALIASISGLLDGVLKFFAHHNLPELFLFSPSFLRLELYKNYGVAFDLPLPLPITITLSVLIGVYLIYLLFTEFEQNSRVALGAWVALIGGFGNFLDRILNGYVTDYLILFGRSAINLADILILLGILIILYYTDTKLRKDS